MTEDLTLRADDATIDSGDIRSTNRDGVRSEELLERGATVGRYVVLGHLGSGGMGAVFAAYDPELDRRVALKLLHHTGDVAGSSAQDRLVREAQAMAKLRHPNVVVVHDVGVVAGRVFVAMEFVEGSTLTRWLADEHALTEIVAVMTAAGRGLAAAHRAGFVHRDFKPDNVLIGTAGGASERTVVVTDFGLARALDRESEPQSATSVSSSASVGPLTVSGAILGTPAYMAPEQFERNEPGAAADQFSFCVALHEAVYGIRPYAASSIAELVGAVTSGRIVDPPPGRRVPAWLRRIILRGLATDSADRFASMDALLERLARDPGGRRRQVLALVGAASIAGGIGVLATATADPPPLEPCPRADERLAGVWDDAIRDSLRASFDATGRPFAASTADAVVARLDGYATSWLDAQQAACRATRVDGSQSEAMLDLRMSCLERRRGELGVRGEMLIDADAALVERAIDYVGLLVPIDVCDDTERLASADQRPEDPDARARVDALLLELDRIDSEVEAGRADEEVLERGRRLVAEADAIGHAPTQAEASYRVAGVLGTLSRFAEARVEHERALAAAVTGHHDALAAEIWAHLVFLVGYDLDLPDEGVTIGQGAELAIVRAGDRPDQRAILEINLGSIYRRKGDYASALRHFERALEIRTELYGADDPRVASVLNNLANAHNGDGDFERGLALLERVLEIRRAKYGPSHPRIAEVLNNMGAALNGLGRYEEALARFEEALAIRRALYGEEHVLVANTLGNVGSVLMELERLDEAEDAQRRVLTTLERMFGTDSPKLTTVLNNLANTLERRGKYDEALALHERSVALRRRFDGPDSLGYAHGLANMGVVLENVGRKDQAREKFTTALGIFDRAAPDNPDAIVALTRLSVLELAAGRHLRARELATRAIAICEASKLAKDRLAEVEYLAAQAHWELGDHRRAHELATKALADLRAAGNRSHLDEPIASWLASHVP